MNNYTCNSKIYIAGHTGLVGSAIVSKLYEKGFKNMVTSRSSDLDLRNKEDVDEFFREIRPEIVFLAAAKVGGIYANSTYPAEFIYDNLSIELNVINAAKDFGVKKLIFLGSSCIYPRECPQPMKEEYLLSGFLEKTNEPYAVAKIAGVKLCEAYRKQYKCNFISVMPTNLYGPGDNFDILDSHVIPALIRKFHEAKINREPEVLIWGTGKPKREFLHVDDLADALIYLMKKYDEEVIINIGTGKEISISELAELIRSVTGYKGKLKYDTSKPDGTPRKLLDVSRIFSLGWRPKIDLDEGIKITYDWFQMNYPNVRGIISY